jgi:cutinase
MKNSLLISIVAAAARASPLRQDRAIIQVRDTTITANDYINGGCRDVILFFARGTTEPGNMVRLKIRPAWVSRINV